jgi:uncharacterized delta-60 repeat protein
MAARPQLRSRPATALLALLLGALMLAAASPSPVEAAKRPGTPDRSFGAEGVPVGFIPGSAFGTGVEGFGGMALTSGGRIVLAGSTDDAGDLEYALGALRRNGRLDTGFGELPNHVVVDGISGDDEVTAAARAPGGQFYIAAESFSGQARFGVARFGVSGALDAGFAGGSTTTTIGTSATPRAIAVRRDGKVLVAGQADVGGIQQIALVRYLPNGLPDGQFGGGDGVVTTPVGTAAVAGDVEIAKGGKLVVCGSGGQGVGGAVVLRYRPNGSLDQSFGAGGIVSLGIGRPGAVLACEVGARGKIVVAAAAGRARSAFVARLTARGKRDRSFGGGDGLVRSNFHLSGSVLLTDLALQRNGKIVLAGIGGDTPGVVGGTLLARLRANGAPDAGFASRGSRLFLLGASGGAFPKLAILPNGKILVAGMLAVFPDTTGYFAARFFGDPVRR